MITTNGSDVAEHPVNNIVEVVENLTDTRSMIIYGHGVMEKFCQ